MKTPTLLISLAALLVAAAARAQWQNSTYALKGGWNAIYLHGEATHAPISTLFAGNPEVEEVLAKGPTKSAVRLANGTQVDLRVVAEPP